MPKVCAGSGRTRCVARNAHRSPARDRSTLGALHSDARRRSRRPRGACGNAFFYIYALIATCLVFGLAGCLEGRRAARFRSSRDEYRDLAEHDDLTALANARAFAAHQRRAAEHSARYREPLSLLLLDVDQLKAINDTLGHKAGGAALVRVAEVLNECKRGDDLAARWGGDEFALLMCGADVVAARRQAESIVERLRTRPLRVGARERRSRLRSASRRRRGAMREISSTAPIARFMPAKRQDGTVS